MLFRLWVQLLIHGPTMLVIEVSVLLVVFLGVDGWFDYANDGIFLPVVEIWSCELCRAFGLEIGGPVIDV